MVKNLFAQENIYPKIRLKLAAKELTTVLRISMLADNPAAALKEFEVELY